METKKYIAIDLKSFYASVECVERDMDPLNTNLVVADASRTEKTICLAVSPGLKSFGIPGRPRLFEVVEKVREINRERRRRAPGGIFRGSSSVVSELTADPSLALDYVVACPQMAHYVERSTEIYKIYLKYAAPEDIHVYSIDEVFIDITSYLSRSESAHDFAARILREVFRTTGITATVGIGTNLFLAKVAMDIVAKHMPADADGARIAELDELSFRRQLWNHRPLTDFWRIGHGYAKKLEENGLYTLGDVARCSLGSEADFYNEELLYRLFGVNAELLIDHAWGWEPCTIEQIRAYRPGSSSISSGQVLQKPYSFEKAEIIVREMTDALTLELVDRRLLTDRLVLMVGYDVCSVKDPAVGNEIAAETTVSHYGRRVPKPGHGSARLPAPSSSGEEIMEAVVSLYRRIVDPKLYVRRITVSAEALVSEEEWDGTASNRQEQLNLFTDYEAREKEENKIKAKKARERRRQEAVLAIKNRYGRNAILRGISYQEDATARERNGQIGGHRA